MMMTDGLAIKPEMHPCICFYVSMTLFKMSKMPLSKFPEMLVVDI